MIKPVRILLYLLIAAAILAASALGVRLMAARSPSGASAGTLQAAVPVRVAPVSRATLRHVLAISGEIEPLLQVDLKPKIAARLDRLALDDGTPVEEGTPVKAGAVVARLDRRDLDAQAAQAAAAVATAQAAVRAAQTALEDAQREKRRAANLFAQGSVTEQARDRAAAAADQAEAALDQARAQQAQAEAGLLAAEVLQSEALIRAPFDGVIAAADADPGAMLSPAAPLLRLVSLRELRILAAVPTLHLPALTSGRATAEVAVDVWPDRVFPCAIRTVHPEIAPDTRTATVELRVTNPDADPARALLRPGLSAVIRFTLDTRENVVAVPAAAILRVGGEERVFLADGGVARSRVIVTGLRDGGQAEVLAGLAGGEPLVVQGQTRLTDGTAIAPIAEREADAAESAP